MGDAILWTETGLMGGADAGSGDVLDMAVVLDNTGTVGDTIFDAGGGAGGGAEDCDTALIELVDLMTLRVRASPLLGVSS